MEISVGGDSLRERFLLMGKRFGWFSRPLDDMIAKLEEEINKRGETKCNGNLWKGDSDHVLACNQENHNLINRTMVSNGLRTVKSEDEVNNSSINSFDAETVALERRYESLGDNALNLSITEMPKTTPQRTVQVRQNFSRTTDQTPSNAELQKFESSVEDSDDLKGDKELYENSKEKISLTSYSEESCIVTVEKELCNEDVGVSTEPSDTDEQEHKDSNNYQIESLTTRLFKKYNPEKSESDMDDFELFLQNIRTPKQPNFEVDKRRTETESLTEFIVDDGGDDDVDSDNEVFCTSKNQDESSDSDDCIELEAPANSNTPFFKPTITASWRTPKSYRVKLNTPINLKQGSSSTHPSLHKNALDSLLTPFSIEKDFKKNKSQLVRELFELYNRTIFDNQLPSDFQITWNNKMRSTAGFCYYSRKNGVRVSRIELADKVIDSSDRLRDTLVHEMCHAAAWMISGVKAGHGPVWKQWTRRANSVHETLPPISRCHSYTINAKYTYRCTNTTCGNTFGRHSKSVNCEKSRCAYCHGRVELVPPLRKDGTPQTRTPNRFAMFVKENFARVKRDNGAFSHQDIMRTLSSEFAKLGTV